MISDAAPEPAGLAEDEDAGPGGIGGGKTRAFRWEVFSAGVWLLSAILAS